MRQQIPLCVDCDGTLIATDLLYEAVFLMLKQDPFSLLWLPLWLLRGKAYLKRRLAEKVRFRWDTLPYREEVIDLIQQARSTGRNTVLATASPQIWADGIARHLGCFDQVIGTSPDKNLSGRQKAAHLVDLFGEKNFEYAGDAVVDLPVWKQSASGVLVSNRTWLKQRLVHMGVPVVAHIEPAQAKPFVYLRALRVHQWLKNLLIFVPLMAAHQVGRAETLLNAGLSFLAFSLCASSVYVLNDLLDLESDRQHVRKRTRPFAAGSIPVWQGMLIVPLLLGVAFSISSVLPLQFVLMLLFYFLMTVAYSVRLKRQVIVDVMMLAGLYTVRIIAGAAATAIKPSFWLLAFSMFIFLSLAMVKRYSELLVTLKTNKKESAGRGYSVEDLPVLLAIGVSAGIGSVLIFSLYINSPETAKMYSNTQWLWLIPPVLLYWNSRVWMKAHRGEVDDDPVVFAARDWQSLTVLALSSGIFTLAILG